jgi:hypothetical protein
MKIRTLLFSLALLAVVGTPLQAQTAFGFHAGAVSATLDGFDANSESKWGFLVGGRFEWITDSSVSLVTELNFAQKGGSGNLTESGAFEVTSSFVEIPVLLDITYDIGQRGRVGVYTGMEFGFNVGCTVEQSGGTADCGDSTLRLEENSLNVAWPLGVEYSYRLDSGHRIGLDVRYSMGISNAVENQVVNFKNKAWYFMARWMLPTRI